MSESQIERPRFFEQQYLDSKDLTAIVEFAKIAQARHDLASHTWGIAIGLQLAEVEGASGLDVYVQPGYAIDGFGRPVVVTQPYRLPADLFKQIQYDASLDGGSPEGRGVPVWIEYYEQPSGGPENGYRVCNTDDQYDRLQQLYRVHVGDRPTIEQRRDPINIGGRITDAERALRVWGDGSEPLIGDASVPYQIFPETENDALWLIPLGIVRWYPNPSALSAGKFVARDDSDLEWSDRSRRYSGVVAETVNAARGFIRFRNRFEDESPSVWSDDLVWCEGSLRVSGDVNVLGGSIVLRDSTNGDSGTQFALKRLESNGLPSPDTGKDIAIQIGSEDNGQARFVVGPVKDGETKPFPVLVARDNGTVGIGVDVPNFPLTIKGQGDDNATISMQDKDGRESWYISQNVSGVDGLNFGEGSATDNRLFIARAGKIGIHTNEPTNELDVRGNTGIRQNRLYLSGGEKGSYGWASLSYNAHHRENNTGWTFPDTSRNAVAIDLDDDTGVPKFEFKSTTNSNKTEFVRRFYINGNTGQSELNGSLSLGGSLAVDGTLTTESSATVRGSFRIDGSASIGQGLSVSGSGTVNGSMTVVGNLRSNGRISAGNVAPVTALHVQGNVSGNADVVANHVAFIDNISTGNSADVLALRIGTTNFNQGCNFITFLSGSNGVGAIEGNGSGGVRLNATGADYAEYLPKIDSSESFKKGDIVGVFGGRISKRTAGADHILVISTASIVLGNRPKAEDMGDYEEVAMLGQVPVSVYGNVRKGDFVLAAHPAGKTKSESHMPDGSGIAVSPDKIQMKDLGRIVGVAWDDAKGDTTKLVNVGIGLPMNRLWELIASRIG